MFEKLKFKIFMSLMPSGYHLKKKPKPYKKRKKVKVVSEIQPILPGILVDGADTVAFDTKDYIKGVKNKGQSKPDAA